VGCAGALSRRRDTANSKNAVLQVLSTEATTGIEPVYTALQFASTSRFPLVQAVLGLLRCGWIGSEIVCLGRVLGELATGRSKLRSRPLMGGRVPRMAVGEAEDGRVGEVNDGRDDVTELLRHPVLESLPAAPRRPSLLADLPKVVEYLCEWKERHLAVFGDSADGLD
jgi:hypothetical protein